MKKVLLSSNPYRDKNFRMLRQARQILEAEGVECSVCLVFEVDQKTGKTLSVERINILP